MHPSRTARAREMLLIGAKEIQPKDVAMKRRAGVIAAAALVVSVVDHVVIQETAATSGDVDVDADINLTDDAKRGADIVKDGARQTRSAVKEGAEKIGSAIVDSVTDKDRDSDKDGK